MAEIHLELEHLRVLFPFFIAVDEELNVTHVGDSLRRLLPKLEAKSPLLSHLEIVRPQVEVSVEGFLLRREQSFILKARSGAVPPLKGQVLWLAASRLLLFLVRPWIDSGASLFEYGLSARDFAIHDSVVDYLFLLQAQQTNMRELRQLTSQLQQERSSLRDANRELGMVYGAARLLNRAANVGQVEQRILELVCSSAGFTAGTFLLSKGDDYISAAQWPEAPVWKLTHRAFSPQALGFVPPGGTVVASIDEEEVPEMLRRLATDLGAVTLYIVSLQLGQGKAFLLFYGNEEKSIYETHRQALGVVARNLRDFVDWRRGDQFAKAKENAERRRLKRVAETAELRNRQKSRYLAHVSHDLRTPMNAILGMSELLLRTEQEPKQRDYSMTIRDSTRSLLSLINASLDLAKIEAGEFVLKEEPFDLWSLVDETAYLLAHEAKKKGLQFSWEIDQDVPRAMTGDTTRIRQVLTNLLGNAVKFTERGSVHLRAGVEASMASTVRVLFVVSDTGPGIAAEDLHRVFESFSQTAPESAGGSGLGLAISRALASLMDSDLELKSQVGHGTRISFRPLLRRCPQEIAWHPPGELAGRSMFFATGRPEQQFVRQAKKIGLNVRTGPFETAQVREGDWVVVDFSDDAERARTFAETLRKKKPVFALGCEVSLEGVTVLHGSPLREQHLAAQLLGTVPETVAKDEPQTGGKSALIVDDSEVNRRLLVEFLKLWGLEFEEARDGREAVEMWATRPFDVIIMDCQMPKMDGYAATREIRRREKGRSRIPIIAVTAHAMSGEVERCMQAGMDAHLSKPVLPEELSAKLDELLGQKRALVCLDESIWDRLVELDRRSPGNILQELCAVFSSECYERLESISVAVGTEDRAVFDTAVHRLKGSAANLGAQAIASLCASAEQGRLTPEVFLNEVEALIKTTQIVIAERLNTYLGSCSAS
jgi:signal transduction histidine kinase/DNA-binding response OmpR family regulator